MNLVKDIEKLKEAKYKISIANSYSQQGLIFKDKTDTSVLGKDYMDYVLLAEKEFIEENKSEILKIAELNIQEELDKALLALNLT